MVGRSHWSQRIPVPALSCLQYGEGKLRQRRTTNVRNAHAPMRDNWEAASCNTRLNLHRGFACGRLPRSRHASGKCPIDSKDNDRYGNHCRNHNRGRDPSMHWRSPSCARGERGNVSQPSAPKNRCWRCRGYRRIRAVSPSDAHGYAKLSAEQLQEERRP